MIKRLRTRFILLSTASLLLLLAVIVASSSLLTYRELVSNADRILDRIAANGGRPMHLIPPEKKEPPAGNGFWDGRRLSPEILYEARFFSADLSADGQIKDVNTESIAMIDGSGAAAYAELALKKRGSAGFIGDFRYLRLYNENGIRLIFLDCGRHLSTFKHALFINGAISLMGLIVISAIIVVFSGKIVRPVSESYEKQKQFISMAGHEIRTPITVIDADAEILAMELGGDNEWLQDICFQTKRMAALTNDMLVLSRMDENRQRFTMIDFPVSDVVSGAVQSFQTLAHSRGRNIRTEIAPALSCHGDEGSLRQVVNILLDNAVKYTKENEDGQCDDVILRLEKKGHHILLSVRNSADAVSDEQLRQFFDRFYRAEQSGSPERGGYGLGLSIAKAIVETHKGRITASAPETGSVQVTVLLPVK